MSQPPHDPSGQPSDPYQPPAAPSYPSENPPTAPLPPVPPYQPGQATPMYPGAPVYPTSALPPPAYANPAPTSNKKTLIILFSVIGGVVLLLCCLVGGGALLYRAVSADTVTGPRANPTNQPSIVEPTRSAPRTTAATTAPAGRTTNLALGQAATFSDSDGRWTVAITSREWRDTNCDDSSFFPDPDGRLLVVDVVFEVLAGEASINPLYFDYKDSAGRSGDFSFFSGCDEPDLESDNNLPAGTRRTGKLVFDVTGGQTGTVEYSMPISDVQGSWKITP